MDAAQDYQERVQMNEQGCNETLEKQSGHSRKVRLLQNG